jgi:Arc/MetJ-type ribon-helix-helix transcriptional regulator
MANVFNNPQALAANRQIVAEAAAVGMQPQAYLSYIETNPEFRVALLANNLSMVPFGQRMSSRVRRAVEVFDPSPPPTQRRRAEPSPPPVVDATTLGSALERLRRISHTEDFLAANEPLYPVPLRTYSDDDPFLRTPGPPLNVFFDDGLTEVCESVFGPRLTRQLITAFSTEPSKLSIRNFFEIDNPGRQCVGVFAGQLEGSLIPTHCWICGTSTGDRGDYPKECEHKFPILPALLVTGLYDSRLQRALQSTGRTNDYKALLRSEYAYAHRRCNRVKSDSVFARLRYTEGGNKTVTCVPAPDIIMATLTDIRTRNAATFTPQRADLERKIRTEPAWDGRDTTRALTIPAWGEARGMDAWDVERARHVAASVGDAAAKFNEKNLSAKTARLHIVNALLTRAINLVPELVKENLWSSLSDAGRAAVTKALGSRGGRRRRTRRAKHQRGGGEDDEVLESIFRVREKEANLEILAGVLETRFATVTSPKEYSDMVIRTLEEYIKWTDDRVTDTLRGLTPESLDDLLLSVEMEEEDGETTRVGSQISVYSAPPSPVASRFTTPTKRSNTNSSTGSQSTLVSDDDLSEGRPPAKRQRLTQGRGRRTRRRRTFRKKVRTSVKPK